MAAGCKRNIADKYVKVHSFKVYTILFLLLLQVLFSSVYVFPFPFVLPFYISYKVLINVLLNIAAFGIIFFQLPYQFLHIHGRNLLYY